MKEETTKAGRLYGVCSAGECVVTDAETGLVLVTLDGSKQEAFIAPGSLVYLSDDSAVVTELFKLAPCRGVAAMMLLRKAGGLLPKGFTELEYLETSGTQYIELPEVFRIAQDDTPKSGIKIRSMDYKLVNNNYIFRIYAKTTLYNNTSLYIGMRNTTYEALSTGTDGHNHFQSSTYEAGKIYTAELNFLNSGIAKWDNDTRGSLWEMITTVNSQSTTLMKAATCKFIDSILSYGTEITRELIPVLDENGTPCMFDKISSTCFRNQGTGTFGYRIKRTGETTAPMSPRDPYYTAPSGVYARHSGENVLEILADTEEVSGDGWVWFANTGEAYERFGITQDELLTE